MKTGMRKIWIGIILFYLGLFTFMALYDEKLNPEVESLLQKQQPEIIEPENAWLAIVGGDAPAGQDPYAYGVAKLQKVQEKVAKAKSQADLAGAVTGFDKNRLEFKGKMPGFYGSGGSGVIAYVRSNRREAERLLADNKEILSRYENLFRYKHYNEPLSLGILMPLPSFSMLRNGNRLKLLQLAIRSEEGDLAGVLYEIEQEAKLGKLIATSTSTMLAKILANSILDLDIRFFADIAVNCKLSEQQFNYLKTLLEPFKNGEATMTNAFVGEAVYMLNSLVHDFDKYTVKPFDKAVFKPNATKNRMYESALERIGLSKLKASEYANELNSSRKEKTTSPKIGFPFLYNSIGETISLLGQSSFITYIERGHNLEGLRRLAILKVMMKEEQIPKEGIQQFLDRHAAALGNPYSGEAARWEPEKGQITFKAVSKESIIYLKL